MSQEALRAAALAVFAAQGVQVDEEGLKQSLADLGFDSLHAVELQLALEQALEVDLSEADQVEKAFHTMPLADFLAHVVDRAQSGSK